MSALSTRRLDDLMKALRLTRDFPRFVRRPLSERRATEIIRRRLETREARFLRMAQRAIYNRPASPYLKLLRAAGCDLGDLRRLVHTEGLEGALERLDDSGVYVSLDEFKG